MTSDSDFFKARGYKLMRNAIEPIFRQQRVYAVAAPMSSGGGWLVFTSREGVQRYIRERIKIEEMLK